MAQVPRPRSGSIRRRETQLGTSYGLRISWQGRQLYHHLGGSWEGWTEERVEAERAYILAQAERGEYVPQVAPAAPVRKAHDAPTFQVFASMQMARWRRRLAPKTAVDLEWRLRTAMDHFGQMALGEIDVAAADRFVDSALYEREAIREAAAAGAPLTEGYTDARTGRTHERRRRGLSNSSINKVLVAVRRVLKEAVRQGLIERNPLTDRDCYLKTSAPLRPFLELAQVDASFAAARALEIQQRGLGWTEARAIRASEESAVSLARRHGVSDTLVRKIRRGELWVERPERRRNDVARLAIVATLTLAGPRISELCLLDGHHVDLPRRQIHMPRVKTDASERTVPMVPALHEILLAHRAEYEWGRDDPVFATRNGTRNTPDNVRRRILAGVHERANSLLEAHDGAEIVHLTPHALRRTFASLLAEVGVSPRRAMYLLGHSDPKLTMRVYQQVLDMGGSAVEALETVLGCTVEEAFTTLSGRMVLGPNKDSRPEAGSRGSWPGPSERTPGHA